MFAVPLSSCPILMPPVVVPSYSPVQDPTASYFPVSQTPSNQIYQNVSSLNVPTNSKIKHPSYRKSMWTDAEDNLLREAVELHGTKNWSIVSTLVPGRNGKQCRERWSGMLDPELAREAWTLEEDKLLVQLHNQYGNKWAKISTHLPGRSRISLRNRWSYHVRHNFHRISSSEILSDSSELSDSFESQNDESSNKPNADDKLSESTIFSTDEKPTIDPFDLVKFEGKSWEELDEITSCLESELLFESAW